MFMVNKDYHKQTEKKCTLQLREAKKLQGKYSFDKTDRCKLLTK